MWWRRAQGFHVVYTRCWCVEKHKGVQIRNEMTFVRARLAKGRFGTRHGARVDVDFGVVERTCRAHLTLSRSHAHDEPREEASPNRVRTFFGHDCERVRIRTCDADSLALFPHTRRLISHASSRLTSSFRRSTSMAFCSTVKNPLGTKRWKRCDCSPAAAAGNCRSCS